MSLSGSLTHPWQLRDKNILQHTKYGSISQKLYPKKLKIKFLMMAEFFHDVTPTTQIEEKTMMYSNDLYLPS